METKKKEDLLGKLLGREGAMQPLFVDQSGTITNQKTYPTIYAALLNSKSGTVIKLMPGIYRENLQINIGDIKIQANQPTSNVIIMNGIYPSIIVNLEDDKESVQFESIKFAHSCNPEEGLIENLKEYNYMDDQINIFESGRNMNTIFYIMKGKVTMQQCKLSLNVINEANKVIIPMIVLEEGAYLSMSRCELYGSKDPGQNTIGILSKRGSGVIKQSNFYCHRKAGLYLSGNQHTNFTVENCKIKGCFNGITLVGDFKALIESNVISDSQNVGIKIGMCNRSKLSANTITKNSIGVEYLNADPFILNNQITFNRVDGIVCRSKEMIKNEGQIRYNMISQNKQCGIRCTGSTNEPKIACDNLITFNRKCGILVENGATPHIFKNLIQKNLGQGILIKQGSSALVQKNQIAYNMKANIALGGKDSINTLIISNKIHSGRCQGIFIIYGAKFIITKNQIYKNHDGIVVVTSIPRIQQNSIYDNEANGILLIKESRVNVTKNYISNNNAAGMFIRDNSHGMIQKNEFLMNKYELVIENAHETLKDISTKNKIEGQIRIPQNYYNCSLI